MQGRFSLFSRIVEELTYGCASSAWVYAVLAEHQWIIAQYPERAQIDVWGDDPAAVASSSLAPRAAAERGRSGGWRLSGRYTFSSGCDYAQWAILGAFLGEMGDPRHIAYLLVPLAEVEIVDDWQVLGLAGTGSKSLVLHDVFVPEHRVRDGRRPLRRHAAGRAGASRLSGAAGAARLSRVVLAADRVRSRLAGRALDIVCRALPGRVSRGVTKLAESEVVQMTLGEAAAAIDAATLLLHHGRDLDDRRGRLGPQDCRGRGAARAARHGLGAASGRLGAGAAMRAVRRALGLRQRPAAGNPARRDDDPDPPCRQPPGRLCALWQPAARQRGRSLTVPSSRTLEYREWRGRNFWPQGAAQQKRDVKAPATLGNAVARRRTTIRSVDDQQPEQRGPPNAVAGLHPRRQPPGPEGGASEAPHRCEPAAQTRDQR